MRLFDEYYFLVNEKASLLHPYSLPNITTGNDLVRFFQESISSIENGKATLKFDGVNCSLRFQNNQFVLDRFSLKDEEGITADKLSSRFKEGHGLIDAGQTILKIFNNSIPNIQQELHELRMLEKSNIVLNIEFIQGTTNVINYKHNYFVIHNVLEIYEAFSPVRKSRSRKVRAIDYDKNSLERLVKKINLEANKFNFNVVHREIVRFSTKPDLNKILNSKLDIKINEENIQSDTLKNLLEKAKNTSNVIVKLFDKSSVRALSRKIYLLFAGGYSIEQILLDLNKVQAVVDGIVFYHTTMFLGQEILNCLVSNLGPVNEQEGIVINDITLSHVPFKITGTFMTRNYFESKFRNEEEEYGFKGFYNNVQKTLGVPFTEPEYGKQSPQLRLTPGMVI
jgi:hypothetical protein